MPPRIRKPCREVSCRALTRDRSGYCLRCKKLHQAEQDRRRGSAARRGYGHRWRKARALHLAEHPLCVRCEERGEIVPAIVVDHIVPHRGDYDVFWDETNWQGLCKPDHDTKTATEDGGFSIVQ